MNSIADKLDAIVAETRGANSAEAKVDALIRGLENLAEQTRAEERELLQAWGGARSASPTG